MDINSLSHTKWNCKYHIVFAPKYRRKIVYGKLKQDIANILSSLCKRKGVKIVEAEICPDHVHMLVEIPPSISVSAFVGFLKGKSTLMIFERHANLKYKYGNRHFWCRGYYVDTVGKNAKKIQEYIRNQLQEDLEYDQMSLKEYIDPFTGEPVKNKKLSTALAVVRESGAVGRPSGSLVPPVIMIISSFPATSASQSRPYSRCLPTLTRSSCCSWHRD